ncbi:MAG: methionine--tRNA ligase, partial [Candidatus Nanohaloarchaea archaeon]|nr:methionine--tRNA ligase [Candidatus Nanohaloarchaea archaeon]
MIDIADARLTDIDSERTVVTSALPYIHGVPHLGNIVGSLLPADLYHRYLDLRGHDNIFICGSDEHGTPLELSAIEAGETPEEHSDRQHETVKAVLDGFDLDFSLYGRTHTPYNEEQTLDIFKNLYRNGYIVEKAQNLPYCTDCDRFLPDRYIEGECPHCGGLARGDQCDEQDCGKLLEPEEIIDPYCTICEGSNIEFRETKNLFLQLEKFEDELRDWLEEAQPIPDNQLEEVLNLIDEGLEDRCITRDIDWGFPVPHEELGLDEDVYADKVLYVWFDAPIGYIGITRQYFDAAGEEERWKEYWTDDDARTIYSIGKDNTVFHSIIFPSMLVGGAEEGGTYNLPDYEFIHQYLLSDDVQFSKSRGTGLSSEDALELLPADYWRFYLSAVIPENHDTSFSWEDFESKINGELNDNVGNFVNRVLSLCEQWFDSEVPHPDDLEAYTDIREEL